MLRRSHILAAPACTNNPSRLSRTLRDQRGFALILALSMLAILSILGALVLSNSGTDLSVTTNFQGTQQAFYAVDRAIEYGTSRSLLLNMPAGGGVNLITETHPITGELHKDHIDQGGDFDAGGGEIIAPSTVADLGPEEIPTKLKAIYGSDFGANFYRVSGTGQGPNNSRVRVEATIIRLFKNEDESIFVTTGGG